MKRSTLPICLLVALFILVNSCKKSETGPVSLEGKIKTITFGGSNSGPHTITSTQESFYDANGNLSKTVYSYPGTTITETTTYEYLPGKIKIRTTNTGSTDTNFEEDFLNATGAIDSLVQGTNTTTMLATMKIIYNEQGEPVEERHYQVTPTVPEPSPYLVAYYEFLNGNPVKNHFSSQVTVSTVEYATQLNNIKGAAGSDKLVPSVNLPAILYNIPVPGATPEIHAIMNYTFDTAGRVLTETSVYYNYNGSAPSGQTSTRVFTYY